MLQGGAFLQESDQGNTLAAALQQRGYYTAMITSNFFAAPFRHRTMSGYDAVEHVTEENLTGAWTRYTNLIGTNAQHTLTVPLLEFVTGVRRYLDAIVLPQAYPAPVEAVFAEANVPENWSQFTEINAERVATGLPIFPSNAAKLVPLCH